MSQQFQADAQANAAPVTITLAAETPILTTNPLVIPYQNAKAVIQGTLVITPGTATTALVIRVRRNVNGENLVVLTQTITAGFTVGSASDISFGVTDAIPDNRNVSYQVSVQQTSGTGNGTAQLGCFLESEILSG